MAIDRGCRTLGWLVVDTMEWLSSGLNALQRVAIYGTSIAESGYLWHMHCGE